MKEYIEREEAVRAAKNGADEWDGGCSRYRDASIESAMNDIPAADVVPWEWLERYADYFCAGVSMPEFVREAKMFYESTNKAMQGGVIDG
jgi:hypothetical protein